MAGPTTTDTKPPKRHDPETVRRIAAELGETAAQPLAHLRRMVRTLGEERVQQLVQQAQAVEAQGGMRLPDGSRRRSLGGVFFKLAKEQASDEERKRIWPPRARPTKRRTTEVPDQEGRRSSAE